MQLFIWKTKYMNWNVRRICCVGGIRYLDSPNDERTNERAHINKTQLTDTFFAFIYHHTSCYPCMASTIRTPHNTHTRAYTYSLIYAVWLPSICLESFYSADTWWRMRSKLVLLLLLLLLLLMMMLNYSWPTSSGRRAEWSGGKIEAQ